MPIRSHSLRLVSQIGKRVPLLRDVLAARDAAMAERDAVLRNRVALISRLVHASQPGTFFQVILNGASVWLPRDALRTMAHCVHIQPEDGAVILQVETAHLMWMMARMQDGGTFLDVGAATGATTLPVAARFGASVSIIAYEPSRRARLLLTRTLMRNGLKAEVISAAVSDGVGDAEFCELPFDDTGSTPYLPEASSLSTVSVAAAAESVYTVPVTTLDTDLAMRTVSEPVIVKIDVEGFEVHVLRGAASLIALRRPHLSIDIHRAPFGNGETTEAACREFLQQRGYRFENMGHVLLCSPADGPTDPAVRQ